MAYRTSPRPCRECGKTLVGLGTGFMYHPECKAERDARRPVRTRTCLGCGREFQYGVARGVDRRYCSPRCRTAEKRARERSAEDALPGCTAPLCTQRIRSSASPWCEMHYYRMRRTGQLDLVVKDASPRARKGMPCRHCGQPTASRRAFCSTECLGRYRHDVEWGGRDCLVCRTEIAASDGLHRKYCTPACRQEAARLRRYGLTLDQYRAMFDSQNGACAICRGTARLVVDHRHHDGKIRGLLCSECNVGLGMFADSATRMQAAIRYLRSTDDRPMEGKPATRTAAS